MAIKCHKSSKRYGIAHCAAAAAAPPNTQTHIIRTKTYNILFWPVRFVAATHELRTMRFYTHTQCAQNDARRRAMSKKEKRRNVKKVCSRAFDVQCAPANWVHGKQEAKPNEHINAFGATSWEPTKAKHVNKNRNGKNWTISLVLSLLRMYAPCSRIQHSWSRPNNFFCDDAAWMCGTMWVQQTYSHARKNNENPRARERENWMRKTTVDSPPSPTDKICVACKMRVYSPIHLSCTHNNNGSRKNSSKWQMGIILCTHCPCAVALVQSAQRIVYDFSLLFFFRRWVVVVVDPQN